MWRKAALGAAALLILAGQVSAQGIGLGPQVGFQKARDADEGKFMGGAALRLKLSPALGVEGSINYRHEKFADGGVTVRSWPIMATAMLYPVPIVYAAAGMGWYNTTFDVDEDKLPLLEDREETQRDIGWHFGGGLELPLGETTTLSADIRYVFLNYDFEAVPGTELDSDFYVITAGMLFGL